MRMMQRALKCDSTYVPAKFHVAQIYHSLGHLRNALNCLSSVGHVSRNISAPRFPEGDPVGQSLCGTSCASPLMSTTPAPVAAPSDGRGQGLGRKRHGVQRLGGLPPCQQRLQQGHRAGAPQRRHLLPPGRFLQAPGRLQQCEARGPRNACIPVSRDGHARSLLSPSPDCRVDKALDDFKTALDKGFRDVGAVLIERGIMHKHMRSVVLRDC